MQLKALIDDRDAVSPVIGVILMVAITVILAAVIGTFVLGLGDQVQETAPNAQWSWEQVPGSESPNVSTSDHVQLTLSHTGGQSVEPSSLSMTVDATNDPTLNTINSSASWSGTNGDGEIVAGGEFAVVSGSGGGFVSGDEVSVNWQSSSGGTSSTLTSHEVS